MPRSVRRVRDRQLIGETVLRVTARQSPVRNRKRMLKWKVASEESIEARQNEAFIYCGHPWLVSRPQEPGSGRLWCYAG